MKISRQNTRTIREKKHNIFWKVKNSLLELENDFIGLKDRELKIKTEIEELFFKSIIVSIDDMDRFEQKEMKKKTYEKYLVQKL